MAHSGYLTVQEMARRSGFSESALRYYEKIGLLGVVPRDGASGHRRYDEVTAERVVALACLRSAGVSVEGMRRYLEHLGHGDGGAVELRELFAAEGRRVEEELAQLELRLSYLRRKAEYWHARFERDVDGQDRLAEEIELLMDKLTPSR